MNITPELDARFRTAALAEGLVDVRFDLFDSPVGELLVAATDRGVCRISYFPERAEDEIARTIGRRLLRAPIDDAKRELDEYFHGTRHDFAIPLDLRVSGFHEDVLRELAQVPYGTTTTYGALAAKAGHPKAARAVGTVMNRNPIPIVLPCHRVIGANGSLIGYAGGLAVKETLLKLEAATRAASS